MFQQVKLRLEPSRRDKHSPTTHNTTCPTSIKTSTSRKSWRPTDEIKCLKVCFNLFDTKKQDFPSADNLGEIMLAMGFRPTEEELKSPLLEIEEDGSGSKDFDEFCEM